MAHDHSAQPETARRSLVLCSALAAAAVAAASAVPSWLASTPHRPIDLAMQAVPPTSASALLAGICIGFSTLSPYRRLTLVTAVTFPAMHIAITVALAQLLASRPNALIEPLPQQIPIQAWLTASTWRLALAAELFIFLFAAFVAFVVDWNRKRARC